MATTTSCCSAVLRPLRPPLVAAPHPPSPPSRFLPICSSSSKVPHTHLSRRLVSLSRVVFQFFSVDNGAKAGGILDEYVKKALEYLDSLLLHASRSGPSATVESMKAKINVAVLALDSFLQTVPSEVFD